MLIRFWKYHGTGNDFVMVDDREEQFHPTTEQVAYICHRRFGIGADGLIIVRKDGVHLRMVYFNSDGRESTMCGNGGRCFVAFCHALGIIDRQGEFLAVDGPHEFALMDGIVSLRMQDVHRIDAFGNDMVLNTGSPHYIRFADEVGSLNVHAHGKNIRYSAPFKAEGINVNFVAKEGDAIRVRTYERGVEDETLSCGTGVTAAALAFDRNSINGKNRVAVRTLGGDLEVSFQPTAAAGYSDIWLHGPAIHVFSGEIEL
jgi:diaminopimelate epimerase